MIVYRSRAPVDLRCLSRCPHLLSLSLTKCGVTSLSGLSGSGELREITMQVGVVICKMGVVLNSEHEYGEWVWSYVIGGCGT